MNCIKQEQIVSLLWEEFFSGQLLDDITVDDIDEFITFVGIKDLSTSKKNCRNKGRNKIVPVGVCQRQDYRRSNMKSFNVFR